MLSARRDEINQENVEHAHAIALIRTTFPQKESYFFRKASVENIVKNSVEVDTFDGFDGKVSRILTAVVLDA